MSGSKRKGRRRRPGRPPALDQAKRQTVLALLSIGSSRRVAAAYVGCGPTTIARAAQRDPAFAEELARAERHSEIECLRSLRAAARQDRYWRAAAWMLERRNPEDFGQRKPTDISPEQAVGWVMAVLNHVFQGKSRREIDRFVLRIEQLIDPAERAAAERAIGVGKRPVAQIAPPDDDDTWDYHPPGEGISEQDPILKLED